MLVIIRNRKNSPANIHISTRSSTAGLLIPKPHEMVFTTHRLHSRSFLWFIFGILYGSPKTELLWSLWVELNAKPEPVRHSSAESLKPTHRKQQQDLLQLLGPCLVGLERWDHHHDLMV